MSQDDAKVDSASGFVRSINGTLTPYYTQSNVKVPFPFEATVLSNGTMTGTGTDKVGDFGISGSINPESNSLTFSKTYTDKGYSVAYSGNFISLTKVTGTWKFESGGSDVFEVEIPLQVLRFVIAEE